MLSFCDDDNVKGVEVLIGSLGRGLDGISNGSFGIRYGFCYATRSSMLNVELIPKSSCKSIT